MTEVSSHGPVDRRCGMLPATEPQGVSPWGLAEDQAPSQFRPPEQPGAIHPARHLAGGEHHDDPTEQHLLKHGSAGSARGHPGRGYVREVHVAAVLSSLGKILATESFPATAAGYRHLLVWARKRGTVRRAGVEVLR